MSTCIVCAGQDVSNFLDLGKTSLANKFLSQEELSHEEPTFPLRVGFCRSCGHVQLMEHVPPSAMFDDYLYISSMSDTLRDHLHGLASYVVKQFKLSARDLVVDIGSNDGTLLSGFKRHGVRTLGVDPAVNLSRLAQEKGIETYIGYFGAVTARSLVTQHGNASVITSTNSFPHIPDLEDFMKGIDILLKPDGRLVIEAHYLMDLIAQNAFDTIYHEHVSYWALAPMNRLFGRHGFEIVNVERLPIHHGQIRVTAARRGVYEVAASVGRRIQEEQEHGLGRFETYVRFADNVSQQRLELIALLDRLVSSGARVAGYGAPAKGNTLLTFLGLDVRRITYIADRSPLKQNRYTPGTHIPVVAPDKILIDQPDYVLLLAWNFAEEIMQQLAEYRLRGGRFIIPVPKVSIV